MSDPRNEYEEQGVAPDIIVVEVGGRVEDIYAKGDSNKTVLVMSLDPKSDEVEVFTASNAVIFSKECTTYDQVRSILHYIRKEYLHA